MKLLDEILNLLISLLDGFFGFLAEAIGMLFGMGKRKHAYTANFIPETRLLSRYHTGFSVTGRRSLNQKNSYVNMLAMGGTGTGKSSVILIPSLYTMTGSFLVHDPSGELFAACSGHLQSRGYTVKVLHFGKPDISDQYNPIDRAHTSSDILKVATMLIHGANNGKGKDDPFWANSAISLTSLCISIIKTTQPKEYQNLYNVRQLLNQLGGNPKAVDALFEQYADPILFAEYKSFIALDEKVVSGTIATCKAALNLFADENVARVTTDDTIDMEEFRRKPVALFIQNSVADVKYYAPLTSLFFEQFFAPILNRIPAKEEQDIFLLIDEASSLVLPTLPLFAANCRKSRAGVLLLVQDYRQLVHNYGEQNATAIKANCFTKMYFTGQPIEECKILEDTLGKFEYKDEKDATVLRSLMTADEIRTMPTDRAIIICGHHAPIRAKLRPYYKRSDFRAYSKLPPAVTARHKTTLLTIPLPYVEEEA